ncbi:MAG: hypothetical protein IIY78_05470 [Clostridia bacterium]|nr:hypothetical protein [Clostridia bacterium]
MIPEYIKAAMLSAHFSPGVIEKYLTDMGEVTVCTLESVFEDYDMGRIHGLDR